MPSHAIGRASQVPGARSPHASSGQSQYSFASQSHAAVPVSPLVSPLVSVVPDPFDSLDDPSPSDPVDTEPPASLDSLPPSLLVPSLELLLLELDEVVPRVPVNPSVSALVVEPSPATPSSPHALIPPSAATTIVQIIRWFMSAS